MTINGRFVVGIAAVCAIVAACVMMYRTRPSEHATRRRAAEERARELIAQGEAEYAGIAMLAPDDMSRADAIRVVLDRAYIQAPPPPGAGELSDLLDHVADFAANYFGASSPEQYRRWRDANGYELVPLAELNEVFLVGRTHEQVFGRSMSADATVEEVFDAWWRHEAQAAVRFGRVARIASEPRGLVICGGTRSRVSPALTPLRGDLASDGLTEAMWNGSHGVGLTPWYGTRGLGTRRLIMVDDSVLHTDIGLIVEHTSGHRVPVRLGCVWNPHTRQWSIEHLVYLNYPLDGGAMTTKVF